MKKLLLTATIILMILASLVGCGNSQTELPNNTEASDTTTKPTTESVSRPTTETTLAETEGDTEYEGDASTYYTDVVYAKQIERYYTAISQEWEQNDYWNHKMSPLAAHYYEGKPLDNVGFTFMDLDRDGIWELIIGAIKNAEKDPLIFEIWALKNGEPVMLAQSGSSNRYYLQYAQEDDLWSVAFEAENNAANRAVHYLQLVEGEFKVIQGVVFDAIANENAPWFMTYDLDWDISNDTPIDEDTANSIMNEKRSIYAAQEYFPYSLYK